MITKRLLLLLILTAFAHTVFSQERSYNICLDTDYNAATGCTVIQPEFSTQFNGIDGYISIVTSDYSVIILSTQNCQDHEYFTLINPGLETHLFNPIQRPLRIPLGRISKMHSIVLST